jgi:hypothetical protein
MLLCFAQFCLLVAAVVHIVVLLPVVLRKALKMSRSQGPNVTTTEESMTKATTAKIVPNQIKKFQDIMRANVPPQQEQQVLEQTKCSPSVDTSLQQKDTVSAAGAVILGGGVYVGDPLDGDVACAFCRGPILNDELRVSLHPCGHLLHTQCVVAAQNRAGLGNEWPCPWGCGGSGAHRDGAVFSKDSGAGAAGGAAAGAGAGAAAGAGANKGIAGAVV